MNAKLYYKATQSVTTDSERYNQIRKQHWDTENKYTRFPARFLAKTTYTRDINKQKLDRGTLNQNVSGHKYTQAYTHIYIYAYIHNYA